MKNDVAKLYQLALNSEIVAAQNSILDIRRIKTKILAFIDSVSSVGEIAHIYTFWDPNTAINSQELLDTYMDGVNMLMSIGFELRIDEVKKHEEIASAIQLEDLLFQIYKNALTLKETLNPLTYQDTLDDYFHLGFILGITIEDMMAQYD